MFGFFGHGIRSAILERNVNGPSSANILSTLKMGQSVALKLQSLLDGLQLEHILNTFGHFIGIIRMCACMHKIKADEATKRKNSDILFLQNTRNLQHICTRSPF